MKDYLGHEIRKGDVVLYSEKGCHGYRGSFTEGVVINVGKVVQVLDNYTKERYQSVLETVRSGADGALQTASTPIM